MSAARIFRLAAAFIASFCSTAYCQHPFNFRQRSFNQRPLSDRRERPFDQRPPSTVATSPRAANCHRNAFGDHANFASCPRHSRDH